MRWTINRKLATGTASMMLVGLGALAASWYAEERLSLELRHIAEGMVGRMALTGELKAAANIMRTGQRGALLNGWERDAAAAENTRRDYSKHLDTAMDLTSRMRPLLETAEEQERLADLETHIHEHAASFERITQLCAAGNLAEAEAAYKSRGAPAGAAMEQSASELMKLETTLVERSAAGARERVAGAQMASRAAGAAMLLCAALLVWSLRGNARGLKTAAGRLAEGAATIAATAREMSQSSQTLASSAGRQSESVTQVSSTAQQFASAAGRSAEASREAAELMGSLDRRVAESRQTVDEVVASMSQMKESSDKVSQIVRLIDEIAFQTNLLALNASVEAARAGAAGAGFAVVADEVRRLAERSARAARDTTALIDESIVRSADGNAKLERMQSVIGSVTEDDRRVKKLVETIHSSQQDQSQQLEDVSRGLRRIEDATRSAAELAHSSAEGSGRLSNQAQSLDAIAAELTRMVGD